MSAQPKSDVQIKPSLTIKRRIDARPEKVFAAWTDAEKLVQWFGPRETKPGSVKATMDVRVGGTYTASFTTSDGEYHQVGGTYREVVPNEKLVFTWAWHTMLERQSLVTVTMKADGDATIMTLLHEQFADEAARDGHNQGWSGTLDKLEAMFAASASDEADGCTCHPG